MSKIYSSLSDLALYGLQVVTFVFSAAIATVIWIPFVIRTAWIAVRYRKVAPLFRPH